jgi:putative flippase GtrA
VRVLIGRKVDAKEKNGGMIGGFLRFCVVGGTVTALNLGLLTLFALHFRPNVSFLLAYFPSILLHFALNKWWTFRCERSDFRRQLAQYLAVAGLNFLINFTLYNAALHWLTPSALLANLLALPASMVAGYLLFRRHVFLAQARSQG